MYKTYRTFGKIAPWTLRIQAMSTNKPRAFGLARGTISPHPSA